MQKSFLKIFSNKDLEEILKDREAELMLRQQVAREILLRFGKEARGARAGMENLPGLDLMAALDFLLTDEEVQASGWPVAIAFEMGQVIGPWQEYYGLTGAWDTYCRKVNISIAFMKGIEAGVKAAGAIEQSLFGGRVFGLFIERAIKDVQEGGEDWEQRLFEDPIVMWSSGAIKRLLLDERGVIQHPRWKEVATQVLGETYPCPVPELLAAALKHIPGAEWGDGAKPAMLWLSRPHVIGWDMVDDFLSLESRTVDYSYVQDFFAEQRVEDQWRLYCRRAREGGWDGFIGMVLGRYTQIRNFLLSLDIPAETWAVSWMTGEVEVARERIRESYSDSRKTISPLVDSITTYEIARVVDSETLEYLIEKSEGDSKNSLVFGCSFGGPPKKWVALARSGDRAIELALLERFFDGREDRMSEDARNIWRRWVKPHLKYSRHSDIRERVRAFAGKEGEA